MCKNVAMVPMKKSVDSGEFDKRFHLDLHIVVVYYA